MQCISNISITVMYVMYFLAALFGYLTFYGKFLSIALGVHVCSEDHIQPINIPFVTPRIWSFLVFCRWVGGCEVYTKPCRDFRHPFDLLNPSLANFGICLPTYCTKIWVAFKPTESL